MGISISTSAARGRLRAAVELAKSDAKLPSEWEDAARYLELAPSKSYTPALVTALLARATDERADALSIKEGFASDTYSLRTLCHGVVVPGAHEYGYGLRADGREPMNNQPFFRYEHMTTVDRLMQSARPFFESLVGYCREANDLGQDDALLALAAFLRVRFEIRASTPTHYLGDARIGLSEMIVLVTEFVSEDEAPARLQAVLAAALGFLNDDLVSRTLNDPSRDFPGDVQVMHGGGPILAAEARAKTVTESDVLAFASALASRGIGRGIVLATRQPDKGTESLSRAVRESWTQHRVLMRVLLSPGQLIRETLMWSTPDVHEALSAFPARLLRCLEEVGASDASLARWQRLCDEAEPSKT